MEQQLVNKCQTYSAEDIGLCLPPSAQQGIEYAATTDH